MTAVREHHGEVNRGSFDERHETGNRGAFDWAEPRIAEDGTRTYFRPDKREPGRGRARLGNGLLIMSSVLLSAVATAAMIVSFKAQYAYVMAEKHDHLSAVLEALLLDGGAVIVALVGLALSLKGMSALMCRALNLLFIGASVTMNVFSADGGFASVSVWVLAPVVYALTSDLLIANVRRLMVDVIEDGPIKKIKGLSLWVLRLIFGPVTTVKGFRAWVLTLPSSPGEAHDHPEPAGVGGDQDSRGISGAITVARVGQPSATLPAGQVIAIETGHDLMTDDTSAGHREQVSAAVTGQRSQVTMRVTGHGTSTGQTAGQRSEVTGQNDDRLEKVIAMLTDDRSLSGPVIAKRLGVSTSTGQRARRDALQVIRDRS